MDISLDLYRTFCIVAQNGSLSKAAEKLFISQSAVTQSIKKLENFLGEQLFYRNKNGVQLTDIGQKLYEHIKDSISILENSEEIFQNYSTLDKGTLRVGGGNTLINSMIIDKLEPFMEKYPNIKYSIINGSTDKLIEKVSLGELDLVALNTPYEGKEFANIIFTPIKKSSYVLYTSKKYAKDNKIKTIKDIQNCKFIIPNDNTNRRRIFNTIVGKEIDVEKINVGFVVSSALFINNLVLKDFGIGFCEYDALKNIKDDVVIIKEFSLDAETQAVATLRKESQSKVTKEFIKFLLKD